MTIRTITARIRRAALGVFVGLVGVMVGAALFMGTLALAGFVQAQPTARPILTDDTVGWVRLVLVMGGIGGAAVYAIFKVMYGPNRERVETVARDVDGVGKRAGALELKSERHEGILTTLQADNRAAVEDRERLHKLLGELSAEIRQFLSTSFENKAEILGNINTSRRETSEQITSLERTIATTVGEMRERLRAVEVKTDDCAKQIAEQQQHRRREGLRGP